MERTRTAEVQEAQAYSADMREILGELLDVLAPQLPIGSFIAAGKQHLQSDVIDRPGSKDLTECSVVEWQCFQSPDEFALTLQGIGEGGQGHFR